MDLDKMTIEKRGKYLGEAEKVLIMLHGRGDNALNFIALSDLFKLEDFTIWAPEAEGNTWYPYSFMVEISNNEPYLTNSLTRIDTVVKHMMKYGIDPENLFFLGFSQGACLTLEYTSRNARPYGGIIAFTGGLIGQNLDIAKYRGDFKQTPVFIGSSDFDPHVPEHRIGESAGIIRDLGGNVNKKIYPGLGHTINQDEIDHATAILKA